MERPVKAGDVLTMAAGCRHTIIATTELLSRCKYFQVERMLLNTERVRTMAELQTGSNSFQVLLCTDGCGTIYWENGGILNFYRGDCIFIPANSVELKLHGKAQILLVGCYGY